jgi:hypothetical protein
MTHTGHEGRRPGLTAWRRNRWENRAYTRRQVGSASLFAILHHDTPYKCVTRRKGDQSPHQRRRHGAGRLHRYETRSDVSRDALVGRMVVQYSEQRSRSHPRPPNSDGHADSARTRSLRPRADRRRRRSSRCIRARGHWQDWRACGPGRTVGRRAPCGRGARRRG